MVSPYAKVSWCGDIRGSRWLGVVRHQSGAGTRQRSSAHPCSPDHTLLRTRRTIVRVQLCLPACECVMQLGTSVTDSVDDGLPQTSVQFYATVEDETAGTGSGIGGPHPLDTWPP